MSSERFHGETPHLAVPTRHIVWMPLRRGAEEPRIGSAQVGLPPAHWSMMLSPLVLTPQVEVLSLSWHRPLGEIASRRAEFDSWTSSDARDIKGTQTPPPSYSFVLCRLTPQVGSPPRPRYHQLSEMSTRSADFDSGRRQTRGRRTVSKLAAMHCYFDTLTVLCRQIFPLINAVSAAVIGLVSSGGASGGLGLRVSFRRLSGWLSSTGVAASSNLAAGTKSVLAVWVALLWVQLCASAA